MKYEHKWIKTFSRPHTIQRISFLWPFLKTGLPQDKRIKIDEMLVLPSGEKYDYYVHEDEWMIMLSRLGDYLLARSVGQQEKEFFQTAEAYLRISKKAFDSDLSEWSNGDLIDWFKGYSEKYTDYVLYAFTPWCIDYLLASRLSEDLKEINSEKSDFWMEIISTPTKYNNMILQQMDLLRIAINGSWNKLKEHAEKYFWLPIYNIGDKPWTEEDFRRHISEVKNPELELKNKEEGLDKRCKDYQKVLREINPSPELKRLIETVHLYTHLRDERVDKWRIALYYIEPFYAEVAKRAGI